VAAGGVTKQSISAHLEDRIAKWWMPDDIVFIDALSYGATGKIQKMELRHRFAGHYSSPPGSAGDDRALQGISSEEPAYGSNAS
jgi:acyl-CoA synthetase (AMP-forming)/AMP-acid ligase II